MSLSSFLSYLLSFLWPASRPDPPEYTPPPVTQEDLDYASLAIIDLSKAATPEGRKELAVEVSEALRSQGFFYVINHGYTQEQTNRIFSIADVTFEEVSEREKRAYSMKSQSVYQGYKPKQTWNLASGVRDQIEHYNINHRVNRAAHPTALRPYMNEVDDFARHCHFNILYPILRLLALGLDLPEDTLVNQHKFEDVGESSVRFMKYHPRTDYEELKTKNVWLKGHTDIGSITILWSQPVGGLQILSPDGHWRWVRHIDNALVINAGDVMEFLCGGYYPSTRHRVILPPSDQRNIARLGVFYFAMAADHMRLTPHEESEVLKRIGVRRLCPPGQEPTMEEWRTHRTKSYGTVELTQGREKNVEEEIVHGVVVKHYN
ncbi:Clavaminate synthase-like protein [Schizophyllum commune Tattone D]|nr:Clavaminate synthase-like protein [Schizophyllum commune Tattone D]